ncbi:hypothetical protein [Stenotrophomonas sp. NPDC077659]|uniref:hypothetical protein n=1 Tax=Stenotrophomonas sp. NPDC077659 TaxID=3390694 RepID=UPI003CFBE95D
MFPSSAHPGIRTAPIPSGWVQTGERWALWWNAREVAVVAPDGRPDVRLWMQGRKPWQSKSVRAASIAQGKRFAERWCAARLYPHLRLHEAVARLVDATLLYDVPSSATSLPPIERQQVRRLAEAGGPDIARIKQALEARRPLQAH